MAEDVFSMTQLFTSIHNWLEPATEIHASYVNGVFIFYNSGLYDLRQEQICITIIATFNVRLYL